MPEVYITKEYREKLEEHVDIKFDCNIENKEECKPYKQIRNPDTVKEPH